jgi:hypothetical protein
LPRKVFSFFGLNRKGAYFLEDIIEALFEIIFESVIELLGDLIDDLLSGRLETLLPKSSFSDEIISPMKLLV